MQTKFEFRAHDAAFQAEYAQIYLRLRLLERFDEKGKSVFFRQTADTMRKDLSLLAISPLDKVAMLKQFDEAGYPQPSQQKQWELLVFEPIAQGTRRLQAVPNQMPLTEAEATHFLGVLNKFNDLVDNIHANDQSGNRLRKQAPVVIQQLINQLNSTESDPLPKNIELQQPTDQQMYSVNVALVALQARAHILAGESASGRLDHPSRYPHTSKELTTAWNTLNELYETDQLQKAPESLQKLASVGKRFERLPQPPARNGDIIRSNQQRTMD